MASTPLELLENRPDRIAPLSTKYFNPFASALAGFGFACFLNYAYKKPVFSGVQRHVLFTLIGAATGSYFDGKRDEHLAERDAVLRHYIELHPEDFPPFDRKKYGEVLESWVPIR